MDIEDAEYEIINHLLNTGTIKRINLIYFEDHERRFKDIKRFFSYLYGKFYILKRFMIFKKLKKLGFEINIHSNTHYIISRKALIKNF